MLFLVSIGITAFSFITAIVQGVQKNAIDNSLGSISHITVEPFDEVPRVSTRGGPLLATLQLGQQREKRIENWQVELQNLSGLPGVTAVVPTVTGSGFAERGSVMRPVSIRAGSLEDLNAINNIQPNFTEGTFRLNPGDVILGVKLAERLSVTPGDRIRIRSGFNIDQTFLISGLVSAGNAAVDESTVYITLADGQRLLRQNGTITAIEIKLSDVFLASAITERLRDRTSLKVIPWLEQNAQVLTLLSSQNLATGFIRGFALLSVTFGIASVLNVTVSQKNREIGILKSMGSREGQIIGVFLFLGAMIGAVGGIFGAVASVGINQIMAAATAAAPRGAPSFVVDFQIRQVFEAVIIGTIVSTLGAWLPARKASKLDPVEAIRGN